MSDQSFSQRLFIEALESYRALRNDMFIHDRMNTFQGVEQPFDDTPMRLRSKLNKPGIH
ncbi:MAG: hypothetical protein AAGF84_04045 [Planctomycetota bacterium]